MEKRKSNRIETPLPESMIHLIQSFLSAKEAAQTTLLCKSWYDAWLTRPALAFNQRNFKNQALEEFSKFAVKTMRRYQDSNLKIESLRLKMQGCTSSSERLARNLIMDAMKMGATDLKLEFFPTAYTLRSETLLRLSVSGCEIYGHVICPMLKALSLDRVLLKSEDMLADIISCCNLIEELSLSHSYICTNRCIGLSGKDVPELHKLKRLHLEAVRVDTFLFDLETRFPCLNDLSLVSCHGYGLQAIRVTSFSLQSISIVQAVALELEFEVPNLVVFSYSGLGIPSISIEARDESESHISIERHHIETSSWYLDLKKLLAQLNQSRINLTISIVGSQPRGIADVDDFQAVAKPVSVEKLRLEANYDARCILIGLFGICRPKFVTHCWLGRSWWKLDDQSIRNLCESLIGPNCEQYVFGQFDLKEVNMEVYDDDAAEWRPLLLQDEIPNQRKSRFHLKW
ncbi:putative F-box/FBD/LRR-repeat protein At5g56810 [Salvia miltiorrhiza]|uniref:putative F-box/FBD/LRR-repeat protein At5g56810 n=1 Tax=Salvia miltiorrhiza TaxID=226208 RepID=UPI0025AC30B4|nr:putative F-box/FBD/LRR-repeat protein At5g56810 [Salvia miltiorrhiza]